MSRKRLFFIFESRLTKFMDMKKVVFLIFSLFVVTLTAQEKRVSIGDFVNEHEGLKENEQGEIIPINDREINKKIRFFVEERYKNVEYTRNIIWDSYETFISPYDRFHYHTFIVQVKVEGFKRLKYLEVNYYPITTSVDSTFEWDEEVSEFEEVIVEKEAAAINS